MSTLDIRTLGHELFDLLGKQSGCAEEVRRFTVRGCDCNLQSHSVITVRRL